MIYDTTTCFMNGINMGVCTKVQFPTSPLCLTESLLGAIGDALNQISSACNASKVDGLPACDTGDMLVNHPYDCPFFLTLYACNDTYNDPLYNCTKSQWQATIASSIDPYLDTMNKIYTALLVLIILGCIGACCGFMCKLCSACSGQPVRRDEPLLGH